MRLRIADCGLRIDRAIAGLMIGAALQAPARAEIIDRMVAIVRPAGESVGGQVITMSDVVAARDLGLQPATGPDPIRAVLTKLIDRELELAEVDRYAPPEPSVEAIDREFAALRARFASPAAFADVLARTGVDERHLRELLRQDLRIRAYEDQRFAASGDRRAEVFEAWMAGLRRRSDVVDLYQSGR